MKKSLLFKIAGVLVAVYSAYVLVLLFYYGEYNFWDFRLYYFSAKCFALNGNPYDLKQLSGLMRENWLLPYAYPPLTLYIFRIFNGLDVNLAAEVFLFIKTFLLICLVITWRKFLKFENSILFFFFLLFAFNTTIHKDLQSGNITMMVQFLLWIGLYQFLNKKYLLFCASILLAAVFKLLPVLFLVLILFTKEKKRLQYFIVSSIIFVSYLMLNYLWEPFLTKEFIKTMGLIIDERGIINPALYWFSQDFIKVLFHGHLSAVINISGIILYILTISAVILFSVISFRKYFSQNHFSQTEKEKYFLFIFCICYSLIVPRFKDYDYILLLLPAYFILNRTSIPALYPLLLLFMLSAVSITLPKLPEFLGLMWSYYPLMLAFIVWLLYIYHFEEKSLIEKNT